MPVGTVSQDIVHKDLRTLPPDGFVDLRKLPYGGILRRRDMSSKMSMEQRVGRRKGQPQDDSQSVQMELMQEVTRVYEFANCIVDHNITDPNDRKLDFSKINDIKSLDPKVGQEIESYIDELNRELDEDEEAELLDFQQPSNSSSESAETQ
jgi:hypothetical protein